MRQVFRSDRLSALLGTRTASASDNRESCCTTGYDNDGSTGLEVFENGVRLGLAMAESGKDAYFGYDGNQASFVLASSEDEACAIVAAWEEDPTE